MESGEGRDELIREFCLRKVLRCAEVRGKERSNSS